MTRSLVFVALAIAIAMPFASAAGAGFYEITVNFTSPFAASVTTPADLSCVRGGVPAPEIEVRCTPATFAATDCKSPSMSATTIGLTTGLTVRSICGPGVQADCAASTSGFALASSCSDDEAALGGPLGQFVCHVVPTGGAIHYEASCRAYLG